MRELSGLSYGEIAGAFDTTVAGAKQAVYEARIALHELGEGREMECDAVRERISAGDRRRLRGRMVRAHLRTCASCRSFERAIPARAADLAALAPPLPVAAAAGLLHGLVGGGAGGTGAGAGSAAGGSLAGSGLAKVAAASIALVAAAGGAAELVRQPGDTGGQAAPVTHPAQPSQLGLSDRSVRDGRAAATTSRGTRASSSGHANGGTGSKGSDSAASKGNGSSGSAGGPRSGTGSSTARAKSAATPPSATESPPSESGTPVGPSYGRSVANANRPTRLPVQAQDRVAAEVPAGGDGEPSQLPGDASAPDRPAAGQEAADAGASSATAGASDTGAQSESTG
jgi:hypothetical protein